MNKKAILFLIFNRPETTKKVFAAIREYQPEQLFIAADGPRSDRPGEAELCQTTRDIVSRCDWGCDIKTRFLESNLGCRDAVSSAVDWFFNSVEEGIILEDDCLPSTDFFRFATAMLDHFRNNHKVMHISGVNFQDGRRYDNADAFYSMIPHIWGWASWRRAWRNYDVNMADYPSQRDSGELEKRLPGTPYLRWVLLRMMERTWQKSPYFNTWDVQWHYTLAKLGATAVTPNVNLVSNIGGAGTHQVDEKLCSQQFGSLPEKLTFPAPDVEANITADLYTLKKIYAGSWRPHLRYLLERIFPPLRDKRKK